MPLNLTIKTGSPTPIYRQIVDQVSFAAATGAIQPGDPGPSVRGLAEQLVINPNTVARAYNVLDQQGLISSKTGSGTFITDPRLRGRDAGLINILAERMDNIITQAFNIGMKPKNITDLFQDRLASFTSQKDNGMINNE